MGPEIPVFWLACGEQLGTIEALRNHVRGQHPSASPRFAALVVDAIRVYVGSLDRGILNGLPR
jgi:hypothetical protein